MPTIKRILLIQPSAFSYTDGFNVNPNPPLGLAYLAAELLKLDFEVQILDVLVEGWFRDRVTDYSMYPEFDKTGIDGIIGLGDEELISRIRGFAPDLIGVSSLFTVQRLNAHHMCRLAKLAMPNAVVVMGGKNPTALPMLTLQDKNVDFIIRGEGERPLIELIKILSQDGNVEDLKKVDGIAFRHKGLPYVSPKTDFMESEELDRIGPPARHLLEMEKYFSAGVAHGGVVGRYVSIITSRGCPAECTFCSAHGSMGYKFRQRSVENVLAEIDHLVEQYGIEEILFEDDNLTLNKKRAKELFSILKDRPYRVTWDTPNGVMATTLDSELIRLMAESGCRRVNLALESGVQRVVDDIIRKPLDLTKVPGLVEEIKKNGLKVGVFLVIGSPGETLDEMRESFRFVRRLKVDTYHISVAMPLPGTELLEICQKNGYLIPGFSWDSLRIDKFSIQTPDWTIAQLKRLYFVETLKLKIFVSLRDPWNVLRRLFSAGFYVSLISHLHRIIKSLIPENGAAAIRSIQQGHVAGQNDLVDYHHVVDEHKWLRRKAKSASA